MLSHDSATSTKNKRAAKQTKCMLRTTKGETEHENGTKAERETYFRPLGDDGLLEASLAECPPPTSSLNHRLTFLQLGSLFLEPGSRHRRPGPWSGPAVPNQAISGNGQLLTCRQRRKK